ncbi:MAG: FAD-dependent oxidoreductase [Desulfobacterales bacterium]|nr:MAG: FAD-dependent oxidoreductase [Desulfobacterales bacterium]
MEHIIIIGGGGTGAALAHDLALRGFKVSLFEKGELLSGTTGRHHGLLHSGARYAVHDPTAAQECIAENSILRRIAPQALEQNDGLFVALEETDMAYRRVFVESCRACGISVRQLSAAEALGLEPALNPNLKLALQLPDATMDAWRLPLQFFATAKANGAELHSFAEVRGIHVRSGRVTGVRIFDYKKHREYDVRGDLLVNATGAWAGKICALAGIQVPVQPGPGVMVTVNARLTNMVINRLHPAGEGDIIVPQRKLSALGTSLWLANDPDGIALPRDHIRRIIGLCAQMVPAVKDTPLHSAWCAARPLLGGRKADDPQKISRTFDCYDHKERDNLEGLVSVMGGKATTLRAMAAKTADLICRKTGRDLPCRTAAQKLLHWRLFYQ